jgi:hypothetical protein
MYHLFKQAWTLMELANITPELVKRLLNTWVKGEPPPEQDMAFSFLEAASSPIERFTALGKIMEAETLRHLEEYRTEHRQRNQNYHAMSVAERILADSLAQSLELQSWSALYYRFFHLQGESAHFVWKSARIDERRFQRRIRQGIAYLTRLLREREQASRHTAYMTGLRLQMNTPENRTLFGFAGRISEIARLIESPSGPAFISIEGLGGTGKTALAWATVDYLRSRSVSMPGGIVWLSARQEYLSEHGQIEPEKTSIHSMQDIFAQLMENMAGAQTVQVSFEQQREKLATLFARERCLIVIDNLETLDDVKALLPELARIAGEARFLLTSRVSLQGFVPVHIIRVGGLSEKDSKDLIFSELKRLNAARSLTDGEISAIYAVVGGIPLALKLVASQAARLPVEAVLNHLQEINVDEPEQRHELMFRYIYQNLWQTLEVPAKRLLLSMYNLSAEGTDFNGLRSRAVHIGLTDTQFLDALQQLQFHSLLEVHGSVPAYSLHRLTATFLRTDIVNMRWREEA